MKLQRQHFLLKYFKILSVDPGGVRTRDQHDSPMLNQLSHRCAVSTLLLHYLPRIAKVEKLLSELIKIIHYIPLFCSRVK